MPPTPPKIIHNETDLRAALNALCAKSPDMRELAKITGLPPLRLGKSGFEGLVSIIISQMVSIASADAIFKRFEQGFAHFDPAKVSAAPEADLRAVGLSGPKIRAIQATAEAICSKKLDLEELPSLSADAAHKRLCLIKGIGPWTADIYLMFGIGHADAFAAGDLALQEAAKVFLKLEARPSAKALETIAEDWRPCRAIAARLLFAYYRVIKTSAPA